MLKRTPCRVLRHRRKRTQMHLGFFGVFDGDDAGLVFYHPEFRFGLGDLRTQAGSFLRQEIIRLADQLVNFQM